MALGQDLWQSPRLGKGMSHAMRSTVIGLWGMVAGGLFSSLRVFVKKPLPCAEREKGGGYEGQSCSQK